MDTSTIDLSNRELFTDGVPHDLFTQLRAENPVFRHEATPGVLEQVGEEFWVLTRHRHAEQIMRDTTNFTSIDSPRLQREPDWRGMVIVSMDPPDHTRLRKLISRGFTPRAVQRLDEMMKDRTRIAFDRALEAGGCDFVHDIAFYIPMHVMGDIVGVPESERPYVFGLIDRFLKWGDPTEDVNAEDVAAIQLELFGYASKLAAEKRAAPSDDVWSVLSTASVVGDAGDDTSLTEWELDLFFMILGVAGIDTTRNALAWGLQALLDQPDQLQRLRDDDALIPAGVEEIVRWTSPIPFWCRGALNDVQVDDVTIPAGARVSSWLASANRDEDIFEDPFRFDIGRPRNPHVGFGGGGPHFCLGANLARMEMQTVITELMSRVADVELVESPVDGQIDLRNNIMRYAKSMPVRFKPM